LAVADVLVLIDSNYNFNILNTSWYHLNIITNSKHHFWSKCCIDGSGSQVKTLSTISTFVGIKSTRGSRSEEIRAKHNQRLMLRLDSERGDTPQTYTKMAAKQQAVDRKKAHETRQGRKVLQPNNGHRVLKEMNGKVVQCNNQNTKGKIIFVEYDDSTISSYDGGSDDESYASGSYYTSDLAYLNDKFDQWLDRIAGIPDKRKRRSKY
jgi:hypothetical protein